LAVDVRSAQPPANNPAVCGPIASRTELYDKSFLTTNLIVWPPAVARLERGETDPRLSTIQRFAEVIGWRLQAEPAA
jgi:transcriptional regulator with XRE-family HTH domain